MDDKQQSRWRPTGRQLQWAGVAVLLTVAVLIGYRYGITLWDWIKLLVVPAVIAGGGLWFDRQQRERELTNTEAQRDRELQIADQRAQDEALQAYIDQIGSLLLDKARPLRQSKEGDEVRTLARARTLTLLPRLDGDRKANVLRFLYESNLISGEDKVEAEPVLGLSGADLEEAYLREASLSESYLEGANFIGANLELANLWGANLLRANLGAAHMGGAHLALANLEFADLQGADLGGANLAGANLKMANLWTANLSDTQLGGRTYKKPAWSPPT